MDEDIKRLNRIYDDLKQQYDDKSSPLMILSDIDADDLEYLRSHVGKVCWAYKHGLNCGRMLLTYIIIDFVYEKYASDDDTVEFWRPIEDYLNPYYMFSRNDLIKVIMRTLRMLKLPVIDYGKKYLNTVLLHSSSKHYSERFFDYILNQYERMIEREIGYDLKELAETISDEFENNETKVSQMSHSFGLLIKDKDIFPSVFDRIINKLDQRMKNDIEYDLGRWEEAFNEWYLKTNSAQHTRSKAEFTMEEFDGEYYVGILFPPSKSVPDNYWINLTIGGQSNKINIPVAKIRGINCSQKHQLKFPVHKIDLLNSISASDSTGVELLNVPRSDARFFNNSGNYAKKVSPGMYKVFIRSGVKHNLPPIFTEQISESLDFITTKLDCGTDYYIGYTRIVFENNLSKHSTSLIFPSIGNTYARLDGIPHITPKHPSLFFETDVKQVHISIRGYDGRYLFNEYLDVKSGELDVNNLLKPETGIYRLNITYEGYRLASVRYLLSENLLFRADDMICSNQAGDIPFSDFDGDDILIFGKEDMYAIYPIEIHGKIFECKVKTPLIFFNPHPSTNEDDWRFGNAESFDTNELEGTLLVAPGCVPDGESVSLIIRSPDGTETISDIVSDGICSYAIYDQIRSLQMEQLPFGIDVRYKGDIFPLFKVNTLGKYDIDIQNNIVAITPYYLPSNCRARFEYNTTDKSDAGTMGLNKTVIFDTNVPSSIKVTETNLDTNDDLIVFKKDDVRTCRHPINLDDPRLTPLEKADRLIEGNGCNQNVDEALRILRSLSEEGDSKATLRLARIYLTGQSVVADLQKASDYFTLYMEQKAAYN